jgi:outer membrane protein assembly factor BamE (lipoprotein component of BamABCDE complex)
MKKPDKIILCIILIFGLAACVSLQQTAVPLPGNDPALFNQLQTGMSRMEVIRVLGKPMTTSHSLGAELFHYNCVEKNAYGNDILIGYGVLFRDDEVVAFGRDISFADDPGQ